MIGWTGRCRSDRYGYCANAPNGWDEAEPGSQADGFEEHFHAFGSFLHSWQFR